MNEVNGALLQMFASEEDSDTKEAPALGAVDEDEEDDSGSEVRG